VPSGGGIHPSRPWCTEHLWDEDVKEFQAEFNILVPQILDSSESTDDVEAAFSGFLERKKKMVTEVKQVCYLFMSGTYIQHFAIACFSTRNSALRGRRTATQIVAQCYPMSRPNVSKSTFIYRIIFVSRKLTYLTRAFGSIKARFVKIGYVAEDVAKIRWHREVSMSKPMSDRGAPTSASIPSY
jgi:hypothetical protein